MCEELLHKNFPTFARIKFVDREFSNINQFVYVTACTGPNFWQTVRKVSLHTWGPQPWGKKFTKVTGFNHGYLRHFSPRSCSWPKLLLTTSEMQIRCDSERSRTFTRSVIDYNDNTSNLIACNMLKMNS
jgi:hypothetical protein